MVYGLRLTIKEVIWYKGLMKSLYSVGVSQW